MKFYVLKGIINGRAIREKDSISRKLAEDKLDKILNRHGLQVESNYFSEKHTEEFVCDQHTRFSISRIVVDF